MHSLRLLATFLVLVSFGLACGENLFTAPGNEDLEILIVRGDRQFGEPGSLLPIPLEVRVQTLSVGRGREGVNVQWKITGGSGASLDQVTSLTDSTGITSARLTLGSEVGSYRVRALVGGMLSSPVEFQAQAILNPELIEVPDVPVGAGDTIQLGGRNLSTDPRENVVTFSRVRGRVISASTTALSVEVPPCLPSRTVELRVQIGALSTGALPLQVLEGNRFLSLDPGEDRILDASEGLACFRVPSAPGARYLIVPHTTGLVGGAEYAFSLVGLTEAAQAGAPDPVPPFTLSSEGWGTPLRPGPGLQWEWDARIRALEGEFLRGWRAAGGGEGPAQAPRAESPPERAPQIGDVREFNVLNRENQFEKVTARIEHVTDHSLIYVDEEAPSGGFTSWDLAELAGQFEWPIYPTVTGAFGSESDLDGNGRVVILLTPAVNRLTPEGSDSYVGGFFFGVDLLEDRTGSNKGEVFYAVVPDATGIHGPVLSRTTLLYSVPSILAHEFEHMVHFNQRILEAGAGGQDALWLSEALAQMAEDLVGMRYREMGDPNSALQYQLGNWSRARRFLLDPSHVSVLATLPPGTLAERGAGWLFLKYLYGQEGQEGLLKTLTGSDRTGVENVTQAVGRSWEELVSDWAGALYLDGVSVPVRVGLRVLGVDLREVLARFDGSYPLNPLEVGGSSFSLTGSLWSSAPEYYIITTPERGGLALNLSGVEGRPPNQASGLRVLVVRLH